MSSGKRIRPVVLTILDGFGVGNDTEGNAIKLAKTPVLASLAEKHSSTQLVASGPRVGLADGAVGCGEAGHFALGTGRRFPSARVQIDHAIATNKLSRNDIIDQTIRISLYDNSPLHLFTVVSPSSTHAVSDHLLAMVDLCDFQGIKTIVHAILDGRDAPVRSAMASLDRLQLYLEGKGATIGTLSGRHFAMDRDGRWDRVHKAFHAIVRDNVLGPAAPQAPSVFDALSGAYGQGVSDAFVEPIRIGEYRGIRGDFLCDFTAESPVWEWTGEDVGLVMHHRGDGLTQLMQMLTRQDLPDEVANDLLMDRHNPVRAFREHCLAALTSSSETLHIPVAFPVAPVSRALPELVSLAGMKQLLVAESEKRMHVTKFFGGGRGQPFAGETREIIGSPRLVESYDLKPEMHAAKIAQKVVAAIQSSEHDLIVVNLANADLVAQTGDIEATVAAVEAIDSAIGAIAAAVHAAGGALLITSDHGNAEQMLDTRGTRSGAHTTNPVPLFFVCADRESKLRSGGDLTDVAPTILELLGIARPPEMTGTSLLVGP